jgi:hypothetical protein
MHVGSVAAIAAVALVAAGAAGGAGVPSFHLVFDGRHTPELLHEGTFTSSASWCSSGSAVDLDVNDVTLTAVRKFSCDGGGDFTAKISPLAAEHGGGGSWQIVGGSGPLADLRGKGTFTSERLSGRSDDPQSITFRSTWDGAADFDVAPPAAGVTTVTVRKLARPVGTYSFRVVLALSDTGGGPVSYVLQLVDPRRPLVGLVYKSGQTATGTAVSTFRTKLTRTQRLARIKVAASDAVGNAAAAVKTVRLPLR